MSLAPFVARPSLTAALALGLSILLSAGGAPASGAPRNIAPFAIGGPDAYGYKFKDSQEADGPVFSTEHEDIGTTGAALSFSNVDDGIAPVTLPSGYLFRFYGQNFTTFNVCTNGNLQFGSSLTQFGNVAFPYAGMQGVIAPYWDDLYQAGSATVRWQLLGSGASARLVVQWSNFFFFPGTSGNLNFQLKLYLAEAGTPSPSDGRIVFNYAAMNGANGSSATIGIQRPDASTALSYTFNGTPNTLADNRSIQFSLNTPPHAPSVLGQAGTSGGSPQPLGFVSDDSVFFSGLVTDPDSGNTLGLEVEVLPSGTPFSPGVTGQTAATPAASRVAPGQVAECPFVLATGSPSGDYHWRARSVDNFGESSAWVVFDASPVHFTVDLVPPSTPTGPYEPSGILLVLPAPTGQVQFSWGTATDAGPPGPIAYRLQVSQTAAFADLLVDAVLANRSAPVNLAASDAPYFWRVAAVDPAGNTGTPSAPQTFQLGWTTNLGDEEDRYPNCGVAAASRPGGRVALLGALAILAGALFRGRGDIKTISN